MNVRQTIQQLRRRLEPEYGAGETQAIIRLIFNYLKGWDAVHIFMNEEKEVSADTADAIGHILARLEKHEPIQYITGLAPFYGLELKVDNRVLIPRPETEMLVDMIVDACCGRDDLDVLDICTGSGCIAIALARNLRFPRVAALDNSAAALEVARANARECHADIDFICADIFTYESDADSLDIVVSNPPYVDESEKVSMDRNVLDYEPASALFVPDAEPLVFYDRIAVLARRALRPGGSIWLEINPRHADGIHGLLAAEGFAGIELYRDIHGDYRFAKAVRADD